MACVFVVWLAGLVLGGLGLFPLSELPRDGELRVGQQPARLSSMPTRRSPAPRHGERPSASRHGNGPKRTTGHGAAAG